MARNGIGLRIIARRSARLNSAIRNHLHVKDKIEIREYNLYCFTTWDIIARTIACGLVSDGKTFWLVGRRINLSILDGVDLRDDIPNPRGEVRNAWNTFKNDMLWSDYRTEVFQARPHLQRVQNKVKEKFRNNGGLVLGGILKEETQCF